MSNSNEQISDSSNSLQHNLIKTKNETRVKNPSINKFNLNLTFIYESILFDDYLVGKKNYNTLKLNQNQLRELDAEFDKTKKNAISIVSINLYLSKKNIMITFSLPNL